MNRSSFALFVALLIHLLLLLILLAFINLVPEVKKPIKEQEKKIKISLKEIPSTKEEKPKKEKNIGDIKKKVEPSPIAPPMPKGSQLKKVVDQPVVKQKTKPKPIMKPKPKPVKKSKPKVIKPKPIKPKPKHKPKTPTPKPVATTPKLISKPKTIKKKPKPKPKIAPYIALKPDEDLNTTKKPKKQKVSALYSMLSQDKSEDEPDIQQSKTYMGGSINQNIKELYGDEFGKLSAGQQKYILNNQEIMRRITQQVLTRVASVNLSRNLNVNKTNVIEFYLHPNGDMTGFKFLKKSGFYTLDDTTKETIEYAYSKYPRPTETTLIRYNVFYNLGH